MNQEIGGQEAAGAEPSILIIGADGLLGSNARRQFSERGLKIATASHRSDKGATVHLDLEAGVDLADLPDGLTHALFCAAIPSIDRCASEPETTRRFNVERTCQALAELQNRGIMPIFCSSDAVYSGDEGLLYDEQSERAPLVEYGRQKVAVEDFLAGQGADYLVIRMSKLFTLGADDTSGVVRTAQALRAGETIRAAIDQYLRPTHVDDVLEAVERLTRAGATGVFNLVPPPGEGSLTRYQLASTIAKASGGDTGLIETCSIDDFDFVEPRPKEVTMASARLFQAAGMYLRPFEAFEADLRTLS